MEDPDVLLTDSSCAYSSVDHRWMFTVLERKGVPQSLQVFLRGIYIDSITSVENAGAVWVRFAMLRGVKVSSERLLV